MASENVREWIEKNSKFVGFDVLEIGSKKYKDHADLGLREFFLRKKKNKINFVGCDVSEGEGVDVVVDVSLPRSQVAARLSGKTFDTIFCVSVMEHIPNIFSAASNIQSILRAGGSFFISVPFVFRYHGYPGDFWRFTPEAVEHLFPEIDFADRGRSLLTTLNPGESLSLKNVAGRKLNRFIFRPKSRQEMLLRKRAKQEGGGTEGYSLAPVMINMLGIKRR
jgi:SAM-dependent methyltransferase